MELQKFWSERGLTISIRMVRISIGTNSVPANIWAIRSNLTFDSNGNATIKEKDDGHQPE